VNSRSIFRFLFLILLLSSQVSLAGPLENLPSPVDNSKVADDEVRLAEKYELGTGTGDSIDLKKAYDLYSEAAELGNAEALYKCGCMASTFGDPGKALSLFNLSASKGYAQANFELGLAYEFGHGVETNMETAAKFYARAAVQGNADAMDHYGVCYCNGTGVKQDCVEALKWFRKAVELGNRDALFDMGIMYANGTGVSKNWDEALYWYYRAALRGHKRARLKLDEYAGPKANEAGSSDAYQLLKARARLLREKNEHALLIQRGDTKQKVISILGEKVTKGLPSGTHPFEEWIHQAGIVSFSNDVVIDAGIGVTKEEYDRLLSDFERDPGSSFSFYSGDARDTVFLRLHESPFQSESIGKNVEILHFNEGNVVLSNDLVIECEPARMPAGGTSTAQEEQQDPALPWASFKPYDVLYPTLKPDDPRYWALATSALLTEVNKGRHDMLGTDLRNESQIIGKDLLAFYRWWSVASREDLLETLDWIKKGGHRNDFEEMGQRISSVPQVQLNDLPPDAKVVLQNYTKLGKKSLLGWDYSRYILLCRWGYLDGYLTEEEAWERIMPVAKMLQKTFDSWADLGGNYMIGRRFWSPERQDNNRYQATLDNLVTNPLSPWKLCPWNMNLESTGRTKVPNKISYHAPPPQPRPPSSHPPYHPPFNLERWLKTNQSRLAGTLVGGGAGILVLAFLVKFLRRRK
jgi:TPR repeat protein